MYNHPMMRKVLKSEEGQTALEYLLMVAVVVALGLTFFTKMNDYLLQNPNGLINKPLKAYTNMLTGGGDPNAAYRRFYVRKASR